MMKRRRAASTTESDSESDAYDCRRPRKQQRRMRARSTSIQKTVRGLCKAADRLGRMDNAIPGRRRKRKRRRTPSSSPTSSRHAKNTRGRAEERRTTTSDQQWARPSRLHLEDNYATRRTKKRKTSGLSLRHPRSQQKYTRPTTLRSDVLNMHIGTEALAPDIQLHTRSKQLAISEAR